MTGDWMTVDWSQDRPTLQELIGSWGSLRWEPQPLHVPELESYLAQVSATHVNGGYLVGRWRAVEFSGVTSWFLSRNRFEEYELLRVFFDDDVVRAELSELRIPLDLSEPVTSLRNGWPGALGLDGMLANLLVAGGAYESFEGPARDAKDLAVAAVDALTQRRYEDFRLDSSHDAWTPWFHDVAWDSTFVLTDRTRCEVTVLCVTDTD